MGHKKLNARWGLVAGSFVDDTHAKAKSGRGV